MYPGWNLRPPIVTLEITLVLRNMLAKVPVPFVVDPRVFRKQVMLRKLVISSPRFYSAC